jgi:LAO/AO transport system kinase
MIEIADIIVVNKADRPEAQRTVQALKGIHMLQETNSTEAIHHTPAEENPLSRTMGMPAVWNVPILQTSALDGTGVSALLDVITAHRKHLVDSGQWDIMREKHIRAEVEAWFQRHMQAWLQERLDTQALEAAVSAVLHHEQDPASAAQALFLTIFMEQDKS